MAYWGSHPEDCDFAFGAVGVYILLIKERMLKDIAVVIEKSYPEQSIVASLVTLRLLGERFPKCLSVHFGKKDFAQVKAAFEEWYAKVSGKLPAKFRDAILSEATSEFALFEETIFKRSNEPPGLVGRDRSATMLMPQAPTPIAIGVIEHEGKYLIGQRPAGKPLAGLWEFPGGKVEAEETPQEAAARECLEETGLRIVVGPQYPEVVQQYDHDRVRLYFFACTPADVETLGDLVAGYRWVAGQELATYEFPAANAGLIAHLAGSAARH